MSVSAFATTARSILSQKPFFTSSKGAQRDFCALRNRIQLQASTVSRKRSLHGSGKAFLVVMASAETGKVEVFVKGAIGEPTVLGDCPFSQRVLLTLEEKNIPYEARTIDVQNKPAWFLEVNPEGKVPVIKYAGEYVPDSDVIVGILEKDYPDPSLVTPEDLASTGSKLFSAFVKFLKSQDANDGTEDTLLAELGTLNEDLAKVPGPYVAGEKVSAVDLNLAPKLYALRIALKHFKKWSIPERFSNVLAYIAALESRESFQKTAGKEEYVISGWARVVPS